MSGPTALENGIAPESCVGRGVCHGGADLASGTQGEARRTEALPVRAVRSGIEIPPIDLPAVQASSYLGSRRTSNASEPVGSLGRPGSGDVETRTEVLVEQE